MMKARLPDKDSILVVCLTKTSFYAHPETLEPYSCAGNYDPYIWKHPPPHKEMISVDAWQLRRIKMREQVYEDAVKRHRRLRDLTKEEN